MISYAMGCIAAAGEIWPRMFHILRPLSCVILAHAPNRARALDGYDVIADWACGR